jgi:glycosyltransferase involved in cell wall biosynthesis
MTPTDPAPGPARRGILLIGNYPPPFGGIPTHLLYLAEHLAQRGWQVHVLPGNIRELGLKKVGESIFLHRPTRRDRFGALLRKRNRVPCLAAWRHLHPTPKHYLTAQSFAAYIKKIVLEHDIKVISAYHLFDAATTGAVISEDCGIPLITTIFGEIYSNTSLFLSRMKEVEHVARHTVKWLSCSHHCAKSIELLGLPIQVDTLHYGIDTRHFHPGKDGSAMRTRFRIPPGDRAVIFVGRMKGEMGLGVLLEAIPLVLRERDRIHFIIVGSRGELTEQTVALGARHADNVHVAVDLPYDELPLAYAAADLAVAPSVNARACLGLAIAEALATGRPVIGCDVGGTREVLVDGEVGVVIPPNDPLLLRDAIVRLLDDPARLAEMGSAGRKRVESRFDKDQTNRAMEAIVEAALDRGGRMSPEMSSARARRHGS